MKRKTVFWAGLFALLALAGVGASLLMGGGTVARVYVDGEITDTVDLNAVAVPYEKTYRTDWGWNTVRFSHGAVQVLDADCPGHDCVEQGEISDGVLPITCLPHRLVIRIEEP